MINNDPDIFMGMVLFTLFAVFGSLLLLITQNHSAQMRLQVKLFLCALALRFATSVLIYQFGLVDVLKDEDASAWRVGAALQQSWVREGLGLLDLPSLLLNAFEGQHRGYFYMLAGLFFITDAPARLPAAALNCFFGAITVVFAYRIARSLFSPWVAARVGWWTCLFPSMIIWSAQTLKEPVIILLETVALYGCVHLKLSGFSLRHILLCALAVLLVIPFRFYAAYIAGAAVMLSLVLPQFGARKLTVGSGIGIAALVIPILMFSGLLVRHEAQLDKLDLQRIEKFRHYVSAGTGSGVDAQYDLETPDGLVMGVSVGAAHLMLAPFPWQLGGASLRMLLTLPDLLVWWWLFFVGVIPGAWYAIRNRFNQIQPLLFFIFGLGLLYSLMFGNVGLVYRQRAQLLPWLLILAAVGLEQRMLKRRNARANNVSAAALVPAGR